MAAPIAADPMAVVASFLLSSTRSRFFPAQRPLWGRVNGSSNEKARLSSTFSRHILNDVKEIQDYYAEILGEFETLVLLSLLRLGNGAYGAAILRDIRERARRDVSVGTLYMTLARLERKKMVVAYEGAPTAARGGRRRKHYVLDTAGEHALGRAYRAWRAMSEGLEDRLETL
jgi:PadR family transcriptional regulator, regulatory protein PadR